MKLTLCVLIALTSAGASAQTMKRCVVDGKTVYTDQACAPGDQVKEVRITDNIVDLSAERRISERSKQEIADAANVATDSSDCDYALSKFRQLIKILETTLGKSGFEKIELTVEAVAVRTKCSASTAPVQQAKTGSRVPHYGSLTRVANGFVTPHGEFCPAVAVGALCEAGFVTVPAK